MATYRPHWVHFLGWKQSIHRTHARSNTDVIHDGIFAHYISPSEKNRPFHYWLLFSVGRNGRGHATARRALVISCALNDLSFFGRWSFISFTHHVRCELYRRGRKSAYQMVSPTWNLIARSVEAMPVGLSAEPCRPPWLLLFIFSCTKNGFVRRMLNAIRMYFRRRNAVSNRTTASGRQISRNENRTGSLTFHIPCYVWLLLFYCTTNKKRDSIWFRSLW